MNHPFTKLLAIGCLAAGQAALSADPQPIDPNQPAVANGVVNVQIHTPGGVKEQEATFSANGHQTIVIDGGDLIIGGEKGDSHSLHIKMLQNMANKIPANNKHAREHLEKHLMRLLSQDHVPKNGHHQVMAFSTASAQSVIDDGEHRISVTSKDKQKELQVTTADGKEIYNGPWNTEADKKKVAPEIREKVEKHQAVTHFEITVEEENGLDPNGNVPNHPLFQNQKPAKNKKYERKRTKPVELRDDDGRRVY